MELSECLTELHKALEYSRACDEHGMEPDPGLLQFLIGATFKKLHFFENKYGFNVSNNDLYYVEDFMDFFRKAEEFRQSNEKQA